MSAGPILMDVLERVEAPDFQEGIQEAGGNARPDGVRPMLWEMRFNLAHVAVREPTWMMELEHASAHVLAAESAGELRAALIHHAAVTTAWVAALDARGKG